MIVVGALVVLGSLFPFVPQFPHRVRNHAVRSGRQLAIPDIGVAQVPQATTATLLQALAEGPVTIDLVIRAEPGQSGPARILTLSGGIGAQSLMIGQSDTSLVVRVRRPGSSPTGTKALTVDDVFDGRRHAVQVELGVSRVNVVVDGIPSAVLDLDDPRWWSTWDRDHRILLGNEHGGTRPWIGRILHATATMGDGSIDLVATSVLPNHLWRLPESWIDEPPWFAPWDPRVTQVPHAMAFAVLGWLATRSFPRRRPTRIWMGCAALSLALLVLKFFVAGRHPSVADLFVEVAAAAAGIMFARVVAQSQPGRP